MEGVSFCLFFIIIIQLLFTDNENAPLKRGRPSFVKITLDRNFKYVNLIKQDFITLLLFLYKNFVHLTLTKIKVRGTVDKSLYLRFN